MADRQAVGRFHFHAVGSTRRKKERDRSTRKMNDCYNDQSYRRSIQYAIERANRTESEPIPHWTLCQFATRSGYGIAETEGLDVARAVAGQKSISVTHRYNHSDVRVAIRSALKRSEKNSDQSGKNDLTGSTEIDD